MAKDAPMIPNESDELDEGGHLRDAAFDLNNLLAGLREVVSHASDRGFKPLKDMLDIRDIRLKPSNAGFHIAVSATVFLHQDILSEALPQGFVS